MLDQRLQILVTREQRRRLEEEARRTGASVGALIREAVDERYGGVTRDERIAAAERITSLAGRHRSVHDLDAVLAARYDDVAPEVRPPG
jgi:hypothetical protein